MIFQRRLAAIRDTLDTLDKSIEQVEKSAQLIFDLAAIVEQQTQQRALDRLFQMFCYLAATRTGQICPCSVREPLPNTPHGALIQKGMAAQKYVIFRGEWC